MTTLDYRQYMRDAGWDRTCIEATVLCGCAEEDARRLALMGGDPDALVAAAREWLSEVDGHEAEGDES